LNARERFLATMEFGRPDRVPFYDEDVREGTLKRWYGEGLPKGKHPRDLFGLEKWERLSVNLDMIPKFKGHLRSREDFDELRRCYDPEDPSRYPKDWDKSVDQWQDRDYPLGIEAWPGFFQPLNVSDPATLRDLLLLIYREPDLLEEMTQFIGEFSLRVIGRALDDVDIDYAILSEPIADNTGPIVAPWIFEKFVIPCYERIVRTVRRRGVDTVMFQTVANVNRLIPICVKAGVNALRCGSTKPAGVDYALLRRTYGRNLKLIGGIDCESLALGKEAIRAEIMKKVPYLLSSGGYVPMVDNRVRENVPFENYVYYRELISELSQGDRFTAQGNP
jgi:hypothetical protein